MTSCTTDELERRFQEIIGQHGLAIKINQPLPNVELVSMDVEHDESGGFVGVGFYVPSEHTVYYFSDLSALDRSIVEAVGYVAHNGLSDIECLQAWGFNVRPEQLVHDTMLIGHIIDSSLKAYGLKDMAKREIGIEYPDYKDLVGKGKSKTTLDKLPLNVVAPYNAMDTFVTWKLKERQGACLY